jgi:hypothetical protein
MTNSTSSKGSPSSSEELPPLEQVAMLLVEQVPMQLAPLWIHDESSRRRKQGLV